MFNKAFLVRLGEQVLVAFLAGFGGVLATTDSLSKAFFIGAVSAGARSAYGVLVRNVGEVDRPEVK